MSDFNWIEVTAKQFQECIANRSRLPCSCRLFFYYGSGNHPEVKMDRYNAKYYVESRLLHRD